MKSKVFLFLLIFIFLLIPSVSMGEDLSKIAVWDLVARNISADYAHQLTDIVASEVVKLGKYEVISQENVRALAGWEAQRMQLGCTDKECLTALGQMYIDKLISGSVGRIGNTYSISLSLFDTKNVRSENKISEECRSEDELIQLVRLGVRKLLGVEVAPTKVEQHPSPPTASETAGPWRPSREVQMVVPYAPGGYIDNIARLSADFLGRSAGQRFSIINKPGDRGILGSKTVAEAKPDGYTLLFGYGISAHLYEPHLRTIPFDPLKDFAPVCQVLIPPLFLCVRQDGPKNFGEFIEWAKNRRIKGAYAVPTDNILLGALEGKSGLKIERILVEFGDAAVEKALRGGEAEIGALYYPLYPGIVPIAVNLYQRHPRMPNVPTFRELGYDLINLCLHYGVAAPKGTPPEVIQFLSFTLKKISEDPKYVEAVNKTYFFALMYMGPQEFAAALKAGLEDYGKWIRQLGIK